MLIRPNMTGDTGLLGVAVSAPRDSNFAREVVGDNLGISAEDLGVSDTDGEHLAGFEPDGDDDRDLGGSDNMRGGEGDDIDFGEGDQQQQQRPVRRARDQFGREPQARRMEQQQQQRPNQLPQSGQVKPDSKGNLVDGSGQIVARAGKEARLYQIGINATREVQRMRGQMETVRGDLSNRLNRAVDIATELNAKVEAFEARDQQIKQLGITPQEQLQATQLVARSKTDPIGTLKYILTQAAANGIDLTQLGVQGGVDMKAFADIMKGEISQHLQPLKERTDTERRQEQERKKTEREQTEALGYVKDFFTNNPEAQQFVPVFHATLQRHPGKSLEEIWARIQLNIERRRNTPQGDGGRTRSRRGAPNGRSRFPDGQNNNSRGSMAPVTQTYEQVARGVFDELGIK